MANYNKHDAPPAYGMQAPPMPVVTLQPTAAIVHFGPESQHCVCPHCHHDIRTSIKVESNTRTHLFALLLCIIFCPCVCLPYCMDSCQSKNHYCPHCNAYLGAYDK